MANDGHMKHFTLLKRNQPETKRHEEHQETESENVDLFVAWEFNGTEVMSVVVVTCGV